jgi:glycosyltransferase involved in cell wall biosynthesis
MINVAVIIPTCRRPHLLPRAIGSVAAQSKPPAEVLVVNDSPDVPVFSTDTSMVRVIETKGHEGPARSRAMAMERLGPSINAICYLDDDDELLPRHIELLAGKIEAGSAFALSRPSYEGRYGPMELSMAACPPASSFIHSVEAHDKIGGWDKAALRAECLDFFGRMLIACGPPAMVNETTSIIYREDGQNRTDSGPIARSMTSSWAGIVGERLLLLAARGRGRPTNEDRFGVPRVAVVMPVYNAERHLDEALDSLDAQTYQDFEVLAVNDGSDDHSREMLARRAGARFRVLDMPRNSGVTKALNFGLLACRSEYIARMDADDVSMPERLAKQVDFLDGRMDVGIVGSMFWSMDESLSSVVWGNQDIPTRPEDVARELLERCCIGHPTVMMRQRVIEAMGGYDESPEYKAVEDYELWLRASRRFRIANIPLHLLRHRMHAAQVSNLSGAQKTNFLAVREKYRAMSAGKPHGRHV